MNVSDDRLTLPPPECCRYCTRLETWTTLLTERHRCRDLHPMHEGCGYRQARPLCLDSAPWEKRVEMRDAHHRAEWPFSGGQRVDLVKSRLGGKA